MSALSKAEKNSFLIIKIICIYFLCLQKWVIYSLGYPEFVYCMAIIFNNSIEKVYKANQLIIADALLNISLQIIIPFLRYKKSKIIITLCIKDIRENFLISFVATVYWQQI